MVFPTFLILKKYLIEPSMREVFKDEKEGIQEGYEEIIASYISQRLGNEENLGLHLCYLPGNLYF